VNSGQLSTQCGSAHGSVFESVFESFKWVGECQQAFDEIKSYLLNPPVLTTPIPGKELILYTTALDGSLGALLAQENHDGNQNALYYLSRMMAIKTRYTT
jgi:RNase H-like domain found in reverse transcriptase